MTMWKVCTVDMALRDLDKSSLNMVPDEIMMESDTILVQYIIKSWKLQNKNPSTLPDNPLMVELILTILSRQWNRWIRTCPGPQKKNHQWAAYYLSSKHPHSLNSLCNKLFQAFLLWIHNIYESHVPASADNTLYFCFPVPATNSLCQDDWCLAHIFSVNSICRGIKQPSH